VCSRFDYFYFKRLMSSFQLRKMCCAGKRGNPLICDIRALTTRPSSPITSGTKTSLALATFVAIDAM
jgi:hypothetical protein